MKHFFYVYVLVSETDSSIHYTGMTQELAKRLGDHNRVTVRIRQNSNLGGLRRQLLLHLKRKPARLKNI